MIKNIKFNNYELREITEDDTKSFIKFKKTIAAETTQTLLYKSGNVYDLEFEQSCLKSHFDDPNVYNIGMFDNELLVGYANFRRPIPNHPWTKHVASFGMMVIKSHWSKGIGQILLSNMEELANTLGVTRIEALVRTTNDRALRLYQRAGYNIEGLKKSTALINNNYQDEYIIAKILNKNIWLPPTIETDRLILRALTIKDAQSIYEYTKDPVVSKFTTWHPHQSIKDTEAFILDYAFPSYKKQNYAPLGITLKERPMSVIGTVDCSWSSKTNKVMESAYALSPKYWRQGITSEALHALIQYCLKHTDVQRIQARCCNKNIASRKVMQKVGMSYEGTLRSSYIKADQVWDMDILALLRQ